MAVSTALAVLGTAPFAQAAIVKGTITGTWNVHASGDLNLGDSFTAAYEYDDTTISPYNSSQTDYSRSGFSAALSKLKVSSGSYEHIFDFTPGVGSGSFHFEDYAETAPTYTPYNYRLTHVSASDTIGLESNSFSAYRSPGQYNETPFLAEYALAATRDSNTSINGRMAYTYTNVNFSPTSTAVTAVPTPALLPGLAAFGLGVWRKRKQAKQVEV